MPNTDEPKKILKQQKEHPWKSRTVYSQKDKDNDDDLNPISVRSFSYARD